MILHLAARVVFERPDTGRPVEEHRVAGLLGREHVVDRRAPVVAARGWAVVVAVDAEDRQAQHDKQRCGEGAAGPRQELIQLCQSLAGEQCQRRCRDRHEAVVEHRYEERNQQGEGYGKEKPDRNQLHEPAFVDSAG